MPTIGWIDALRQYNAGMPSWCVPRKGTPGYESVMRIRRGEEQAKSFKEVLADLERKTSGKPKGEKKSMKIDLTTQSATLPTIQNGEAKTDRPPTKSSTSNNKAMAIVPVNYVAEGGSQKESAKEEKKPLTDLYYNPTTGKETSTLWELKGDEFVKYGHWTIDDQKQTYTFNGGITLKRPRVKGRNAYVNPVGGKETAVLPFADAPDAFKAVVRPALERDGYDVSSLPTMETTDTRVVKTAPKPRAKKEKPVDPLATFKDAVKAAEKALDEAPEAMPLTERIKLEKAVDKAKSNLNKERARLRKEQKESAKEEDKKVAKKMKDAKLYTYYIAPDRKVMKASGGKLGAGSPFKIWKRVERQGADFMETDMVEVLDESKDVPKTPMVVKNVKKTLLTHIPEDIKDPFYFSGSFGKGTDWIFVPYIGQTEYSAFATRPSKEDIAKHKEVYEETIKKASA